MSTANQNHSTNQPKSELESPERFQGTLNEDNPVSQTSTTQTSQPNLIAIGASTGGPKALQEILPMLPSDLPAAILLVQHMPAGFTESFAQRLDKVCRVTVREAEHDLLIEPATIYVAPAGLHLTVRRRASTRVLIQLSSVPEHQLHTPSIDVMMLSVADVFGSAAMGVILTGMGSDGLRGMQSIFKAGGTTIGQDEQSCSVYGMPRSCAEAGVLRRVVPLSEIPGAIMRSFRKRRNTTSSG